MPERGPARLPLPTIPIPAPRTGAGRRNGGHGLVALAGRLSGASRRWRHGEARRCEREPRELSALRLVYENIGRYFTTLDVTLNSQAIVALALYPFTPQYQNFAYYREVVLVSANTELYMGTAAPQPVGSTGTCYVGGAAQYFFCGRRDQHKSQ